MDTAETTPGVDQLIAEARRLIASNRALERRLRARRLWRMASVALAAALAFYVWSLHLLLSESAVLLRANGELMQSGNALLRATSDRQQEIQSTLRQMSRPGGTEQGRPISPRRRSEACLQGTPGCDPSTYWVPGFPGPRIPAKRTKNGSAPKPPSV